MEVIRTEGYNSSENRKERFQQRIAKYVYCILYCFSIIKYIIYSNSFQPIQVCRVKLNSTGNIFILRPGKSRYDLVEIDQHFQFVILKGRYCIVGTMSALEITAYTNGFKVENEIAILLWLKIAINAI